MTEVASNIEVFLAPITKDQLRAIPVEERTQLLLASHAVNQISVMRRILIFLLNYESPSEIENTLSAAQSQTWEMLKRPINQRIIGINYAGTIEVNVLTVYENLKKHFGGDNFLHKPRNIVAYHHPKGAELGSGPN